MKKLIFLFCITFGLAQNNGIRSLNGSLNNSQRLTVDTTSSATFRWGLSNGVHTLYLPYRIVNPSTGSFSWRKSGSSVVTDSIRFIQGSGVSLTQTGYTLTISASGGGSVGNADSLGSLPASDWFLRSDTIGLKSRLLKNADSTTMRNYSNALYSLKAGSSSIVTVGTITSGTWNGTAIDTAYTNAIATITSKTGLITTTRYNTKDFQLDLDTTGTTGLRSKFVPYSGANTAVNLGSQTFTTTGAGSFGALSGTTITASSYVDGDDSVFTSSADSWMGAESGGITPRLAFVKASGFGPELRFLSSSASLFTVRRVTGGTLLAPTASTVDMQIGSTGNVTFGGDITTATGTISGTILDGDSVSLESTTEPSIRLIESGNSGFRLSYDGDGTNDFIIGAGTGGTFTSYLSMARANGALTLSAPQTINSGLNTVVLTLSDVTTDATAKLGRFGSRHYTNSEEQVAISYSNNTATTNVLNWGGGTGLMNSATTQNWYIGATNTTVTGTLSMLLDANGLEVNNKVIADSSFTINERSTTPTLPTSNTQMHMYMKGDKVVWVINAAGTPRYYYFDASATADQQIIYSATAP